MAQWKAFWGRVTMATNLPQPLLLIGMQTALARINPVSIESDPSQRHFAANQFNALRLLFCHIPTAIKTQPTATRLPWATRSGCEPKNCGI